MYFRILIIIIIFLYHSSTFSKTSENQNFNHRYLSKYFSALVSHENGDNDKSSQNHIKVSSPIEVINRVKQLKKEGKKIVLLYIQHLNSTPGYVPLKIQD